MTPIPIPGCGLDRTVAACSSDVAVLDSRVLATARRLRERKAASEELEIEAIEPVEQGARVLQAPD